MNWRDQVLRILHRYNAESREMTIQIGPVQLGSALIVTSPKKLGDKTADKIRGLVPEDVRVDYQVGVKPTSLASLVTLIGMDGAMPNLAQVEPQEALITLQGEVREPYELWDKVDAILIADGFFKKWRIVMNGEEVHAHDVELSKAIEKARPVVQRETVINDDDILNLQIALGTAQNIEDFIGQV